MASDSASLLDKAGKQAKRSQRCRRSSVDASTMMKRLAERSRLLGAAPIVGRYVVDINGKLVRVDDGLHPGRAAYVSLPLSII